MRLRLTTEEMNADFGNTYTELKQEYPNWSRDLHEKGHILITDNLQKIFCRGLLLWYVRYCLQKTGLNLFIHFEKTYNSFYEVTTLIRFFNEINPDIIDTKLVDLLKYNSYQSLMLTDKIKPCGSFKEYSIRYNLNCNIEKLIGEKNRYEIIHKSICGEKSIETFIYDNLIGTQVVKLGIVFQRWKIVLEQMYSKSRNKGDLFMKNMYLLDKFLVTIQEMILLGVKTYVDLLKFTFITNSAETYEANKIIISNIYDDNVYKIVYNEIEKSDVLIDQVTDPENIDESLIQLLESFYKN